jgi:hypothetical protein
LRIRDPLLKGDERHLLRLLLREGRDIRARRIAQPQPGQRRASAPPLLRGDGGERAEAPQRLATSRAKRFEFRARPRAAPRRPRATPPASPATPAPWSTLSRRRSAANTASCCASAAATSKGSAATSINAGSRKRRSLGWSGLRGRSRSSGISACGGLRPSSIAPATCASRASAAMAV